MTQSDTTQVQEGREVVGSERELPEAIIIAISRTDRLGLPYTLVKSYNENGLAGMIFASPVDEIRAFGNSVKSVYSSADVDMPRYKIRKRDLTIR